MRNLMATARCQDRSLPPAGCRRFSRHRTGDRNTASPALRRLRNLPARKTANVKLDRLPYWRKEIQAAQGEDATPWMTFPATAGRTRIPGPEYAQAGLAHTW